jgi:hypothetical protein
MTTYAFATTDNVTFDNVVAIMTFEAKMVSTAFGGSAYAARSVTLNRFYFDTSEEAQAFADANNGGENYRNLSEIARLEAQDRAAYLNATAIAA